MDQLRSYYNVERIGKKWWKYVFWAVLIMAVANTWIVWVTLQRPLPRKGKLCSFKRD